MTQKQWTMLVSGKVQGVYYRASTQAVARQLGLGGYARNLPDGRVEVVAEGPVEQLQALRNWCAEGPPAARVSDVHVTEVDGSDGGFNDFQTR